MFQRVIERIEGLRDEARLLVGSGVDLGELPAVLAAAHGDRPAIAAPSWPPGLPGRRVRSYRDLEDDTARLAAAHEALGHTRGVRVAIAVANRIDVLLHVFALVRAGALPVPVNARLKPAEFAEVIHASGATVIVADADLAAAFAPAGGGGASGPAVGAAPGGARWCWTGVGNPGDRVAGDDLEVWLREHPGARLAPARRVIRPPPRSSSAPPAPPATPRSRPSPARACCGPCASSSSRPSGAIGACGRGAT